MASTNPTSISYEPVQGDSLTQFVRSMQNSLAGTGAQAFGQGQTGYAQGIGAAAPVMNFLTQLTKGDQADVSQAIQPEANRIKDSFSAARNVISQQPRGGGKTSALAEAPFKQAQQMGDIASQARQGAAGQLGGLATTLAGMGLSESNLGFNYSQAADNAALQRRNQNNQENAAWQQMLGQLGGAAGTAYAGR